MSGSYFYVEDKKGDHLVPASGFQREHHARDTPVTGRVHVCPGALWEQWGGGRKAPPSEHRPALLPRQLPVCRRHTFSIVRVQRPKGKGPWRKPGLSGISPTQGFPRGRVAGRTGTALVTRGYVHLPMPRTRACHRPSLRGHGWCFPPHLQARPSPCTTAGSLVKWLTVASGPPSAGATHRL